MAENLQSDLPKKDEEWAKSPPPKALPRRKRIRWTGIIIAFVLLKVVIVGALFLTVFRFKDPDIELNSISIKQVILSTTGLPSVNMTLNAEIAVKNKNWGEFKFNNSTVILSYGGMEMNRVEIPKGKVKRRHTRLVPVVLDGNIGGGNLKDDLSKGFLDVIVYTEVAGKVNMMMLKKKRDGEMNCTVTVSIAAQEIQHYYC